MGESEGGKTEFGARWHLEYKSGVYIIQKILSLIAGSPPSIQTSLMPFTLENWRRGATPVKQSLETHHGSHPFSLLLPSPPSQEGGARRSESSMDRSVANCPF